MTGPDKDAGEDADVIDSVFSSGRDRGADSAAPEPKAVEAEQPMNRG